MSTGPMSASREIGSDTVRFGARRWVLAQRHGGHECPPGPCQPHGKSVQARCALGHPGGRWHSDMVDMNVHPTFSRPTSATTARFPHHSNTRPEISFATGGMPLAGEVAIIMAMQRLMDVLTALRSARCKYRYVVQLSTASTAMGH